MNCATIFSQFGNIETGKVEPLRNNMLMYAICSRMALSCTEFTTDAMIKPIERMAIRPIMTNRNRATGLSGITIPYWKCARLSVIATSGRYTSSPVAVDATSRGSGEIGATL